MGLGFSLALTCIGAVRELSLIHILYIIIKCQDASGTQLGYVIQTTTSEGYGGNIVL